MSLLRILQALLHVHWPENPTLREGLALEVCRCGAARYVQLHRGGREAWSTPWTKDVEQRRYDLGRYSREGGIAR